MLPTLSGLYPLVLIAIVLVLSIFYADYIGIVAIPMSSVCSVFTRADWVNILYTTLRNVNMITSTKHTIFSTNKAAIEKALLVTAAE